MCITTDRLILGISMLTIGISVISIGSIGVRNIELTEKVRVLENNNYCLQAQLGILVLRERARDGGVPHKHPRVKKSDYKVGGRYYGLTQSGK